MDATDPKPSTNPAAFAAGSPSDSAHWLRLSLTPGIGPYYAGLLLDGIGPPARIFTAPFAQLAALVPARLARALVAADPARCERVAQAERWLAHPGAARRLLTRDDADYPELLRCIPDPPIVLYAEGDGAALRRPCLAIVGSRNATVNGVRTATAFARAASEAGIAVVSGLAIGIDGAAHEGALHGPGSTVAVLATGLDQVYPPRHRALDARIRQQGCVVGEMPLGTGPMGELFPRRNRIISGLATAVLVVEAAVRSGSLVTARLALDQGRTVMAVPGSIHSSLSKGCHLLIKDGATLVESVQDMIAALLPGQSVPIAPQHGAEQGMHMPLLARLGFAPTDPADLAAATGSSVDTVISQLLALELAGRVQRLPGGMFQRLSS